MTKMAGQCGSVTALPVMIPSLRRHDPDQVRRVRGLPLSQPLERDSPENMAPIAPDRAPQVKPPMAVDKQA